MLANKDADGVIRHLTNTSAPCQLVAVPVPGHACCSPEALAASALKHGAIAAGVAGTVGEAFDQLTARGAGSSVLVAGSLYLAGEVLRQNDELPD
jgi:dihydrofolate synthase / folylpolyglutamate synthase